MLIFGKEAMNLKEIIEKYNGRVLREEREVEMM